MNTIKSLAAFVTTVVRDVAQVATNLAATQADVAALKAELAELKSARPAQPTRTPGRVTESASPIDADGNIIVRATPSVRLEHAVLFSRDCAFKYRAGCAAKYPNRVWAVAQHHSKRGWLVTSRAA